MAQRSLWGKYDIRAVVGPDFGESQYREVGVTYAQFALRHNSSVNQPVWVAVGHDARLHSPKFVAALIDGLTQSGVNVVALGLSTSPVVYFSEHLHAMNPDFPDVVGTVIVTASHNPSEYNGIKFTWQKRTLQADEFQSLKDAHSRLAGQPVVPVAEVGMVRDYNILPEYMDWFVSHFGASLGKGSKVVVDSGNATAGIAAPEVLRRLGCEVVEIFTEPDGRFPNHHPDPCVHKNLEFLMEEVRKTGADFGIAFDGDADRLGIVDNLSRIMPGDQITLFLSDAVLAEKPGSTIVFDIKSTQTVLDYVKERGGTALYAPSGHAYMKRLMIEQDIPLGGELSGHVFFRDRHWGFDDALYAAARFVESFAKHRQQNPQYHLSDFADSLPHTVISEELRVHCSREEGRKLMDDLETLLKREPDYFGSTVTDVSLIDGLRANIENGFFLVRASGTEPCITLRFEAPNEGIYQLIERRIDELCAPLQPAVAAH